VLETTFMNLPDDRVNVSGVAFINAFLDFVGLAVWPKIHGAVKANNLIVKKRDDQRDEEWRTNGEYGCSALEQSNNAFIL
jgi:hypothetical protein